MIYFRTDPSLQPQSRHMVRADLSSTTTRRVRHGSRQGYIFYQKYFSIILFWRLIVFLYFYLFFRLFLFLPP